MIRVRNWAWLAAAIAGASFVPSVAHAASADEALLRETRAVAQLGYIQSRTAANGAKTPSALEMTKDLVSRSSLSSAERIAALGLELELLDRMQDAEPQSAKAWAAAFAALPDAIKGVEPADWIQRKSLWNLAHMCAMADWTAAASALETLQATLSAPLTGQARADFELAKFQVAVRQAPQSIEPWVAFAQAGLEYENWLPAAEPDLLAARDAFYAHDALMGIDPLHADVEKVLAVLKKGEPGTIAWRRAGELQRYVNDVTSTPNRTLFNRDWNARIAPGPSPGTSATEPAPLSPGAAAAASASLAEIKSTGYSGLRDWTVALWDVYFHGRPSALSAAYSRTPAKLEGVDEALWQSNQFAWRMLSNQSVVRAHRDAFAHALGGGMDAVAPILAAPLRDELMPIYTAMPSGSTTRAPYQGLGPRIRIPNDIATLAKGGLDPAKQAAGSAAAIDPAKPESAPLLVNRFTALAASPRDLAIEVEAALKKSTGAMAESLTPGWSGGDASGPDAAATRKAMQEAMLEAMRTATKAGVELLDRYEQRQDPAQVAARRRLAPLLVSAQGFLEGDMERARTLGAIGQSVRENPVLAPYLSVSSGPSSQAPAAVISTNRWFFSNAFQSAVEKIEAAGGTASAPGLALAAAAALNDKDLGRAMNEMPAILSTGSARVAAPAMWAETMKRGASRLGIGAEREMTIRRLLAEHQFVDAKTAPKAQADLFAMMPNLSDAELAAAIRGLHSSLVTLVQTRLGLWYLTEAHRRGFERIGLNEEERRIAEFHRAEVLISDAATQQEGAALLKAQVASFTDDQLLSEVRALPSTILDPPTIQASQLLFDESYRRGLNRTGLPDEDDRQLKNSRAKFLLTIPGRTAEGVQAMTEYATGLPDEDLAAAVRELLPQSIPNENTAKGARVVFEEASRRGYAQLKMSEKEGREVDLARANSLMFSGTLLNQGLAIATATIAALPDEELAEKIYDLPLEFLKRREHMTARAYLDEGYRRGFEKIGLPESSAFEREAQRMEFRLGTPGTFDEAYAYFAGLAGRKADADDPTMKKVLTISDMLSGERYTLDGFKWGFKWLFRIQSNGNVIPEMQYLVGKLAVPISQAYYAPGVEQFLYGPGFNPDTRNSFRLFIGHAFMANGDSAKALPWYEMVTDNGETDPTYHLYVHAKSYIFGIWQSEAQRLGDPANIQKVGQKIHDQANEVLALLKDPGDRATMSSWAQRAVPGTMRVEPR